MAAALEVRAGLEIDKFEGQTLAVPFDPYRAATAQQRVNAWLPFAAAANNVNRCMGLADLYPFVLSPAVIDKLAFIHRIVAKQRPAA